MYRCIKGGLRKRPCRESLFFDGGRTVFDLLRISNEDFSRRLLGRGPDVNINAAAQYDIAGFPQERAPRAAPSGKGRDSLPVVLIPAYQPVRELPSIVRGLLDSGACQGVVVVNDGSGLESEPIFSELSRIESLHLLVHPENLGKGAALKTGLRFVSRNYPGSAGVVTVDADGQHAPEDAARVARELAANPEALVLGVRSFDSGVPLRSMFGNSVTRQVLRLLFHQEMTDTQTGLRGIPMGFVPLLTELRSNRYDLELEMILACRRLGRSLREVEIRTIYTDGNRNSHFHTVLDSMRVYAVFIRFASVSLLSALIDNAVFLGTFAGTGNILVSQVTGRISSLLLNYLANRNVVFHSRARFVETLPGYLCLAAALMLASYGMILAAVSVWGANIILAKMGAETLLFFLSFIVQRFGVFAGKRPG